MRTRPRHPSTWTRLRKALDVPPVQWDALCAKLTSYDRQQLAQHLQNFAQQAARMGAYLEARDRGDTHAKAVQRQNTVGTALRRAIGFAYPDAGNIRF